MRAVHRVRSMPTSLLLVHPPPTRARGAWPLALAVVAACGSPPSSPAPDGPADAPTSLGGVDLVRDDRGVPHLYAATLDKAMYGLGYATAQDRLFQMQVRRATMRGQLAELFAVNPATDTTGDAAAFNARLIASDREMRTLGYARHADAIADRLPGDIPTLLAAYAAGVNAYLGASDFVLAPAFAQLGLPAPAPWTPADALLAWEWLGHHFVNARAKLQDEIATYNRVHCTGPQCPPPACVQPIDEAAAVVPPPANGAWPPAVALAPADGVWRQDIEVKASHSWVVHGSRTTTGKPVLVGSPQVEIDAPSIWYEFHIATPEVNARGVGVAGAPGYIVFWNDHIAQAGSAGGIDLADLFQVTLSADRTTYLVDGAPRPIDKRTELIAVRHGAPVMLDVLETMYGPIANGILTDVPAGRHFAARLVEHAVTDSHSLVAAIDVMRATDLAGYRAALAHWATPVINAVYAGVDAGTGAGHIAYHALGRIPVRQRHVIDGVDYTGRYPSDGTQGATRWTSFHGFDWNPHVIDPPQGYLFTGNHLPIGSWYDAHVYGGFAGVGDTFRSAQLRYRLGALLPPGGAPVDPAAIHALTFDDGSEIVRIYRDMLVHLAERGTAAAPGDLAVEPTNREQKAARVRLALSAWASAGGHVRHGDPYGELAHAILAKMVTHARAPAISCVYNGGEGGAAFLAKAFDADPATTLTPAVIELALAVANDAWDEVRAGAAGPDPAAWTATVPPFTVRYQVNRTCLRPGAGTWCSLDPAHETTVLLDQAFPHTLNSAGGSSYPVTIDFADVEGGRALLPPGASEDPASPFFHDGLAAIVAKGQGTVTSIPRAPRARATVDASATSTRRLD